MFSGEMKVAIGSSNKMEVYRVDLATPSVTSIFDEAAANEISGARSTAHGNFILAPKGNKVTLYTFNSDFTSNIQTVSPNLPGFLMAAAQNLKGTSLWVIGNDRKRLGKIDLSDLSTIEQSLTDLTANPFWLGVQEGTNLVGSTVQVGSVIMLLDHTNLSEIRNVATANSGVVLLGVNNNGVQCFIDGNLSGVITKYSDSDLSALDSADT